MARSPGSHPMTQPPQLVAHSRLSVIVRKTPNHVCYSCSAAHPRWLTLVKTRIALVAMRGTNWLGESWACRAVLKAEPLMSWKVEELLVKRPTLDRTAVNTLEHKEFDSWNWVAIYESGAGSQVMRKLDVSADGPREFKLSSVAPRACSCNLTVSSGLFCPLHCFPFCCP